MLNTRVKNILLIILTAWIVFDTGSAILYSMTYKDAPKQYADLFKDWKGWLVIGAAVTAGAGTYYMLRQKQ